MSRWPILTEQQYHNMPVARGIVQRTIVNRIGRPAPERQPEWLSNATVPRIRHYGWEIAATGRPNPDAGAGYAAKSAN